MPDLLADPPERNVLVQFRATTGERDYISTQAEARGMTVARLLRAALRAYLRPEGEGDGTSDIDAVE